MFIGRRLSLESRHACLASRRWVVVLAAEPGIGGLPCRALGGGRLNLKAWPGGGRPATALVILSPWSPAWWGAAPRFGRGVTSLGLPRCEPPSLSSPLGGRCGLSPERMAPSPLLRLPALCLSPGPEDGASACAARGAPVWESAG